MTWKSVSIRTGVDQRSREHPFEWRENDLRWWHLQPHLHLTECGEPIIQQRMRTAQSVLFYYNVFLIYFSLQSHFSALFTPG